MFIVFRYLPLLSDEGSALASYARSRGQKQFFCYRDLIDSSGVGTFMALLARRLVFTSTRLQFDNLIAQTMSDFVRGVRFQLLSTAAAWKFPKVFGLHWFSVHAPAPDHPVVPFFFEEEFENDGSPESIGGDLAGTRRELDICSKERNSSI
jgi:hypothetical protein